jgi:hypothetical protein
VFDASQATEEVESAAYPAGPYGEDNPAVGEVVENLRLRGLWNPDSAVDTDELTPSDYSFQSFRDLGRTHVLITTAAGWCPSCQQAALDLGTALESRVREFNDRGGLVVNLLLEGVGRGTLPSDRELASWATAAELEVSVMGARDERTQLVFPDREWAYILRLDTMQVVWSVEVPLYNDPTVNEIGLERLELELANR